MPPRRLFAAPVLVALLALLLTATACASVAKPEGWASPVIADSLLLVAHKDKLYALDAETLAAEWQFPSSQQRKDAKIKPIALYGTPAIADGMVYVPTYDGTLYALNQDSAEVAWSADTGGPLIGGVAVAVGVVYFGSDDGKVYALEAKTGDPHWPSPFKAGGEGIWSAPVVSGGTVYVTSLDHRLYALDAATGAEEWSFKTDAGVASIPVVDEANSVIYFGGFDSQLRAIDLEGQEERWSAKAKNWFWARPLVSDGVVYAGSLDGKVYAVDAATGKDHWSRPVDTEAPIRSAPVIVGGALFVVNKDGKLYSLNPATGAPNASLAIEADVLSDPLVRTLSGGEQEIVIVTDGGELVIVDPQTLRVTTRRPLSES